MKYIPVVLLIIILIIPAVTLLNLRKEIGLKQTDEGKVLFFSGSDEFKFSFISPKKNLNSVVLKLKNITIRSSVGRNSKPIYFKLLENQGIIRQSGKKRRACAVSTAACLPAQTGKSRHDQSFPRGRT